VDQTTEWLVKKSMASGRQPEAAEIDDSQAGGGNGEHDHAHAALAQAEPRQGNQKVVIERTVEVPVEQNVVAAANTFGKRLRIVAAAAESCSEEIGNRDGRRVGPVGGVAERRGVHVVGLVVAIWLRRNVAGDE
jgi:hypothetical protein